MPPQPSSSAPSPSASAAPPKGVEFSDHLIVLGAGSWSSSSSSSLPRPPPPPPPPPPPLPKPRVFVKRPQIPPRPPVPPAERTASPFVERPVAHQLRPPPAPSSHNSSPSSSSSAPAHIAPPTETRIPPDEVVLRPPDRRRARFFHTAPQLPELSALSDPRDAADNASDSDSENETIKSTRMSSAHVLDLDEHDLARCTRINTKLNSLPSGGAFSFMNSSEDVDTCSTSSSSSSSSCSSDERLRQSRRMIRVDGSAKLSTASGVLDSTDDEDEHEFSIEGAESVDEEEAVQVRSFSRTPAHATLQQPERTCDTAAPHPKLHQIEANSTPDRERVAPACGARGANLAVNKAQNCHALRDHILRGAGADQNTGAAATGGKHRGRLRVTFMRRNSGRNRLRDTRATAAADAVVDDEDYVERRTGSFSAISCFSVRRTSGCRSRLRGMSVGKDSAAERAAIEKRRGKKGGRAGTACREVVAAPDFDEGNATRRGMVKNVSLQRDDFIDFTTNGGGSYGTCGRGAWLARLVSMGDGRSVSDEESVGGGGDGGRGGRRKRWKLFGRK